LFTELFRGVHLNTEPWTYLDTDTRNSLGQHTDWIDVCYQVYHTPTRRTQCIHMRVHVRQYC
jgi:hypothetical protein